MVGSKKTSKKRSESNVDITDCSPTKRLKKTTDYILLACNEMKKSVSLSQRIRALNKCIDSWFTHNRVKDHDNEILSTIPSCLCLILGYTLTMDTIFSYSAESQSPQGEVREVGGVGVIALSPQQTLVGLICKALYLICSGCSNEARDISFKRIGKELLCLIVQVIEWCLHATSDRGITNEVRVSFIAIIEDSVATLLALSRTGFPRLTMSSDDNTLTAISKISSNINMPQNIRSQAICLLNNVAYDCYQDDVQQIMERKARTFTRFIAEITLEEESYVGKAREYVEAALWNLSESSIQHKKQKKAQA